MRKSNPFARLDRQELVWLFGILQDACRERLEKNLVSQELEERLHHRRGGVPGRVDPRPRLQEWEPRYRKFLAIAGELQDLVRLAGADALTEALAERLGRGGKKRPQMDANRGRQSGTG